jgi:hypothetical protein
MAEAAAENVRLATFTPCVLGAIGSPVRDLMHDKDKSTMPANNITSNTLINFLKEQYHNNNGG